MCSIRNSAARATHFLKFPRFLLCAKDSFGDRFGYYYEYIVFTVIVRTEFRV